MGLDQVELLLALEEEFGIEIPDNARSQMTTVGDVYDWIRKQVGANPNECLSQHVFYQMRNALVKNYGLERGKVKPSTKITDLISEPELEEGWPFLELFITLDTPPYKVARRFFGFKQPSSYLTVREIVDGLIRINIDKLEVPANSDEELWARLVDVFVRQLNVRPEEVYRSASVARDLGCD